MSYWGVSICASCPQASQLSFFPCVLRGSVGELLTFGGIDMRNVRDIRTLDLGGILLCLKAATSTDKV
jgi:hypothetical protein